MVAFFHLFEDFLEIKHPKSIPRLDLEYFSFLTILQLIRVKVKVCVMSHMFIGMSSFRADHPVFYYCFNVTYSYFLKYSLRNNCLHLVHKTRASSPARKGVCPPAGIFSRQSWRLPACGHLYPVGAGFLSTHLNLGRLVRPARSDRRPWKTRGMGDARPQARLARATGDAASRLYALREQLAAPNSGVRGLRHASRTRLREHSFAVFACCKHCAT